MSVSGERISRSLPWLAFALALAAVAAVRMRLLDVPLERDEGEYAYIGSLLLQGVPPFAEAWNMKFPGIYAVYALLMGVGGANVAALHAGLLVANTWNSLAVALLGKRLLGAPAGAVAGAGYAAMSLSPKVLGLWSHAEPFALAFALAGLLLAYGGERLGRLTLAGLLLGTAVVVKQNAGPLALFGAAIVLASQVRRARESPAGAAARFATFALAGLVPFAATAAALAQAGVFERFWEWTFVYALSYGSQQTLAQAADGLAHRLPRLFNAQLVWWLAASLGIAAPLWNREVRARAPFLFGLLAAGALAASFGFYYRPQYFVLLLPGIGLLAGAGVHAAVPRAGRARDLVAAGVALAGLLTPIGVESDLLLRKSPDQLARAVYRQNPFVEAPELGRRIAELTAPDARIAVIGSEPEIYFYAGRRAATGYIYMYPLMEAQPLARAMQDEMISQLEVARPEVMVFVSIDTSWQARRESPMRILQWFNATAARDYEVVARAEIVPDGETRWRFGADARTRTSERFWVSILRRKQA